LIGLNIQRESGSKLVKTTVLFVGQKTFFPGPRQFFRGVNDFHSSFLEFNRIGTTFDGGFNELFGSLKGTIMVDHDFSHYIVGLTLFNYFTVFLMILSFFLLN
jgi:hypothetical protein